MIVHPCLNKFDGESFLGLQLVFSFWGGFYFWISGFGFRIRTSGKGFRFRVFDFGFQVSELGVGVPPGYMCHKTRALLLPLRTGT